MAEITFVRDMEQENNLKNAGKVCLGLLLVLLAGALLFYRERMLFGDAAWIAFLVINKKTLFIQEHRYGSFITQLFPLLGAWLRLPLSVILLLYSASFNLFYLAAGLVLYRIRQYRWLILFCFYLTLIVSLNYFWTNNEVHQGITWMFLLFGFVSYAGPEKKTPVVQYLIFILLAFLAIFTHPLVILVCGFLWVYLLLTREHPLRLSKHLLPFSLILCLLVGLKYYMSTQGWYDGGKIAQVTQASFGNVATALTTKTARDFRSACISNYWWCSLFFIAGFVQLLLRKRYLPAAWLLCSVLGYMILICLINTGDPLQFHIESEWMGLAVIMTIPFVRDLFPLLKPQRVAGLLAVIFATRLVYIGSSAPEFTRRLQRVHEIVSAMQARGQTKVILIRTEEHSMLERNLYISWGLPVETLMYSAIQGDQPALTAAYIFEKDIAQKMPATPKDFLTSFFTITYGEMNRDYFRYDTLNAYQVSDLYPFK